ncbi:MAG: integrase core domain-containing protein [Castellaniella sp.]|uniref:integrase core domain-containing protein n=1 Tax=Castellaniella sp. TaxID=1955812 RepID=UPI003C77E492
MARYSTLALVIDCHTRELLGWHLSRSGKVATASNALVHTLIARFGTLGRVPAPFLLRSDNGLVFTSRSYTAPVRSYSLRQEFMTPHYPQQNGMVERVIRTLKEQCAHRHRFESLQHASRVIYRPRADPRPVGMRLCTDLAFLIPELPPSPGQRGCFGTALGFAGFAASCF